jgi:hypothetical protein
MSRSYPIWNNITACIYAGSKSYGVRERGEVEVRVGTRKERDSILGLLTWTHSLSLQ